MRKVMVVLAVILLALQYRLWFGKNSVPDYLRLEKEVEKQTMINARLTQRNKVLQADVQDLKLGLEAVEERARNELGMIKKGETFYRIVPATKQRNNR